VDPENHLLETLARRLDRVRHLLSFAAFWTEPELCSNAGRRCSRRSDRSQGEPEQAAGLVAEGQAMTKAHFIECLRDVPDDSIIVAWDPEGDGWFPITTMVITPPVNEGRISVVGEVALYTDEN
jgi:hypothetical protein